MNTSGFDKFLKKLEVDIDSKTDKILSKVGKIVYNDVKLNTPVDTGRLRRSWRIKRDIDTVTISNNTEYAKHVEYGHRTRKSVKGNATVKMIPGRFMLRNAVERGKTELKNELTEIKIFDGK